MKLVGLLLLCVVAYVNSDLVEHDINNHIDKANLRLQEIFRRLRQNSIPLSSRKVNEKISYSRGAIIGLDSIHRTGDCNEIEEDDKVTFDYHFGFRFLVIVFTKLTIDGNDMSAVFRIRNNSMHTTFTEEWHDDQCSIKDMNFQIERLSNVEFGSSNPDFDGMDVEHIFQYIIRGEMNQFFTNLIRRLGKNIQNKWCQKISERRRVATNQL